MAELDLVRAYVDGGARGNPGPAAIGVVICDPMDAILLTHREFLGDATNNEAEYRAVARALELAAHRTRGQVVLTSDSELVVRQLRGAYRVRDERMAALANEVRECARAFRRIRYEHRPRMTGHLALADRLVNQALDEAEAGRK